MALISCPECKTQISNKAPACPSCGAPIKTAQKKTSFVTWLVLICIVLAVISSVRGKVRSARDTAQQAAAETERAKALSPEELAAAQKAEMEKEAENARQTELNSARYVCQQFVKKNLNDPDSAEFEPHRSFWAEKAKDGSYNVQVQVRARNAFNAKIKSVFDCKTRIIGSDWVALKIKQMDL